MELYITYGNLSCVSETVFLSSLSASRRIRIERRPYADRIASAAAAHLLRYALCDCGYAVYADAPIIWEGKPHFADPAIPVRFNLSHTVDKANGRFAAAVLLSDTDEVGVDVEFVHPIHNREAMMRRLFSETERSYIETMDNECAFFDVWCAKEAFVKLTGEGFSRKLSSVFVDVSAKSAASGEMRCNLLWYTVGKCRICCASDDLSANVEFRVVDPDEITIYQEEKDGTKNQ